MSLSIQTILRFSWREFQFIWYWKKQNYEFDSLFDYMVDENYHDCGQLIQTDNDRVCYLRRLSQELEDLKIMIHSS